MKQRKKSFGMKISAFVLSFAMVCTLLAGLNVVAFAADDLDDTVNVMRFNSTMTGEHIFTANDGEINYYNGMQPVWQNEGVAWKAPLYSESGVYRIFNNLTFEHMWTTDAFEVFINTTYGPWTLEQDPAFYSDDNSGVPVYRLSKKGYEGYGAHHYTVDETERFWLLASGEWNDEGVAFYGVKEEEPGEIQIVDLEATGSKELTATLNKEAEIDEDDVIVKRGDVTLTPADVTVVGDEVVITLGSKIVKGTYSVTIGSSTKSVDTEDEKLVEFTTVGENFAQVDPTKVTMTDYTGGDTASTPSAILVAAEIEYQAKNQYGENITTDVLQISNTFGGKTVWTEPTAKKNGKILVYDIPAALGIQGTKGNLIVVAKSGVSSTCPVVMSEAAKVALVTPIGVYCSDSNTLVESVPAEKAVAGHYFLVVDVRDQYGRPMYAKGLDNQTCTVAQVLTNVTVYNSVGGKFIAGKDASDMATGKNVFDQELGDQTLTAIALDTANTPGVNNPVAKAGTCKIMAIGDRFGSVMDYDLNVEQIDLIDSFKFYAEDTVYNNYKNEISYEAVSESGQVITDYKTLSKLVEFAPDADGGTMQWKKNVDGSASLIYKPSHTFSIANNYKESTVESVTATCNKLSPTDQMIVPATFTVYEDKMPWSIVKYTGDTATSTGTAELNVAKLVIEDQYGNVMDSKDGNALSNANVIVQGTDAQPAKAKEKLNTMGTTVSGITSQQSKKVYLSVYPGEPSAADLAKFSKDNCQLAITFTYADHSKVTDLQASWNVLNSNIIATTGTTIDVIPAPKAMQYVRQNQTASGVTAENFKVTGKVNGSTITLTPGTDYSLKTDTYEPITQAEFEADPNTVKTAKVTLTVSLTDSEGEYYTEDVDAYYMYSAAPSKMAGVLSWGDALVLAGMRTSSTLDGVVAATTGAGIKINAGYVNSAYLEGTYPNANVLTNLQDLASAFIVYDQYGDIYYSSAPTLEVSLGDNTNGWKVVKNGLNNCYIDLANATTASRSEYTIVATFENGMTASQTIITQ